MRNLGATRHDEPKTRHIQARIVVSSARSTPRATEYDSCAMILRQGGSVLTVNTGVLGSTDLFPVDIEADEVARAGGGDLGNAARESRSRPGNGKRWRPAPRRSFAGCTTKAASPASSAWAARAARSAPRARTGRRRRRRAQHRRSSRSPRRAAPIARPARRRRAARGACRCPSVPRGRWP